ncbi:hypothetical protein J6524_13450 [Bradyrhizobium sp. WSM 1738]|uniref:DUF2306 domain-containing protein n=1 Tax=Bradyrhizobium hereditatis TaxID=2821405 RepID=UPI001CE2F1DC|nr:DUF2306 domain-containing protein [Bradyrhizobium hereditatis]MCA6115888.1 hypothetical protein [Bradyrhizobium hereditatis]
MAQPQPVSSDIAPDLAPDIYERILAVAAIILLLLVMTALVRGIDHWRSMEPLIWGHLATVMIPLAITPVQLLRRRGDRAHRILGWIWSVSLFITAVASFGIRDINEGQLSFIHLFSVVTIVSVPLLVLAARHHQIARHRGTVRGLITGALLTAGYFTLIPNRMLGGWLWS